MNRLTRKEPLKRKKPVKTVSAIKNREKGGGSLTSQQLAKLCLNAWSKLVKLHANHKCEWCGDPATQSHHMRAKAQGNKLKYALENGVALCYGCHVEFHQKDSLKGWLLFQEQRPESYRFVRESTHEPVQMKTGDYRELLADLREQIKAFGVAA